MTTYIALLRGINVGGKNIVKMDKLAQCFIGIGFLDVKTYIQSGNIIFKSQDNDKLKLMEMIENQLLKEFSVEIKTALITADEIKETIENAPENFGVEPEKFRYDVWFLMPHVTVSKITSEIRLRDGIDSMWAGKNVLYTSRLTSEMDKSYFSKIMQTSVYKYITIRNWNTVTKILELINLNP